MRFRLGLFIGFGAGYYLGAMAGRERYEQINKMVTRAKGSDTYEQATEKAKAVVDLGVERARDLVDEHTGDDTPTTGDFRAPGLVGSQPPLGGRNDRP